METPQSSTEWPQPPANTDAVACPGSSGAWNRGYAKAAYTSLTVLPLPHSTVGDPLRRRGVDSAPHRERDRHPSRSGDLDPLAIAVGSLPPATRPHILCRDTLRPLPQPACLGHAVRTDIADPCPQLAIHDRGRASTKAPPTAAEHQRTIAGVDTVGDRVQRRISNAVRRRGHADLNVRWVHRQGDA